jgi:hypothetical protein
VGVEWLYSPDNIGGKVVKKGTEKMLENLLEKGDSTI